MIRGRFVLFTDTQVSLSIDLNGGMGMDGIHGIDALKLMPELTQTEFNEQIKEFNKNHHGYYDEVLTYEDDNNMYDMSENYYDKYFSDYLYIKNGSTNSIQLTIGTEKYNVDSGGYLVTYHGREVIFSNGVYKDTDTGWFGLLYGNRLDDISLSYIADQLNKES